MPPSLGTMNSMMPKNATIVMVSITIGYIMALLIFLRMDCVQFHLRGQAFKDVVQYAAFFAGAHHVHVDIGKYGGVFGKSVTQGYAALNVFGNAAQDFAHVRAGRVACRAANERASGTPADIMVDSCRVNITRSLSLTFLPWSEQAGRPFSCCFSTSTGTGWTPCLASSDSKACLVGGFGFARYGLAFFVGSFIAELHGLFLGSYPQDFLYGRLAAAELLPARPDCMVSMRSEMAALLDGFAGLIADNHLLDVCGIVQYLVDAYAALIARYGCSCRSRLRGLSRAG